jgi:protoheme IX farnesyltransferase
MNTRVDAADAPRDLASVLTSLVQLTKPGITRMVLATTFCGAIIAPGAVDVAGLLVALVGTALVVGAANTLNMFLEADVDALMARTRNRPIPSGRIAPDVALWFGVVQALIGLPLLAGWVTPGRPAPPSATVGAFAAEWPTARLCTPVQRPAPTSISASSSAS